jgi:putative transposase
LWDYTGIRKKGNALLLSLAKGRKPIRVMLPSHLRSFDRSVFKEVRLKWNVSKRRYQWHIAVDDGMPEPELRAGVTASIDLGEIHPLVIGTEESAALITCRELRSNSQYRNKRLASISEKMSSLQKGSRRHRRLQARKNRFLAKSDARQRDMLHKVSREVVKWCLEHDVAKVVFGDVRDISKRTRQDKRLGRKAGQKIANWPHGQLRQYITYKLAEHGIATDMQDEAYTSKTCAVCSSRNTPKGRVYKCRACGSVHHRDVNGQANILSLYKYGELAKVRPPQTVKYRMPYDVRLLRSPHGTGEMACGEQKLAQEAPAL